MRRLEIGTLPLPTVYVCSTRSEVSQCRTRGIPYVVWHGDYDELVKLVLYPTLVKMFPHIDWSRELGVSNKSLHHLRLVTKPADEMSEYSAPVEQPSDIGAEDVEAWQERELDAYNSGDMPVRFNDAGDVGSSENRRYFSDGMSKKDLETPSFSSCRLTDAIGDLSAYVNIEELQKLNIMPQWLGDISDAIRKNLADYVWAEGWNKKLGYPAGNYDMAGHAPNLIIVDVSASIPQGIAATMLSLVGTLREQADADLIVTGATSGWYPRSEKLPSPEYLRTAHPRGNECRMFNAILKKHVLGREWGNVVSFGDNDSPARFQDRHMYSDLAWRENPSGTIVHHLLNFHAGRCAGSYNPPITGYAKWVMEVSPGCSVEHNTKWVESMREPVL